MRNIIIGLIALTVSNICIGATDQVRNVKITAISTYETYAIIYFSPSFSNTQNCTETFTTRAAIRFGADQKKEMFSTALSTAMAGKLVTLGLLGCDASGVPAVYRVDALF